MKKLTLILLFVLSICATDTKAQATASFTASVTIIQPIGITTTSDMNFADIDARTGGAVILSPDHTRSFLGGVELKAAGTVSAATFVVTGEQDFAFSISLPANEYVLTNGSENMIIKDFTTSLAENNLLAGGSRTVSIGATLDVNPDQEPGIYTSTGPMDVTVNYN